MSEKKYYSDNLNKHKNNIKETWKILNEAIKKTNKNTEGPDFFIDSDGKLIKDKKEISNGFHNFFVNVGPKLANDIETVENESIYKYLPEKKTIKHYIL